MNVAGRAILPFSRGITARTGAGTCFNQRRWFDWDPKVTKRDGKPAITGTKHAYVAAKIPVVLLRDVPGLGPKGSIQEVKRGYARNCLVPNGDAVYGTIWENIDAYADPDVAKKQQVEQAKLTAKHFIPFEWLNDVRIEFLRDATGHRSTRLTEPVTIGDVLNALSEQEHVDILPSQVIFPPGGLDTVGKHTVPITLQLTVGSFQYNIKVDVKDKAEVAAAERREAELREAMKVKRPEFVLGSGRLSKPKLDEELEDDDSDSSDLSDSEN